MATILLKYDPNKYWDHFLKCYQIRHEKIVNDDSKFILYYRDDFELMKLGFQFGMFVQKKLQNEKTNV
jgi:hypothetical protein